MPRKEFAEAMQLLHLQTATDNKKKLCRYFMSCNPAWKPGQSLGDDSVSKSEGSHPSEVAVGVYGGCVYAQASLAAAASLEFEDSTTMSPNSHRSRPFIHSIHGVFTKPGLRDRPFVYGVYSVPAGRSFRASVTVASQPKQPATNSFGPFLQSDAQSTLDDPCFISMTTFKSTNTGYDDKQATSSAQERYADLLSQRDPSQWQPCPQIDLDQITSLYPTVDYGDFPMIDMHKVDMKAYNHLKATADQRQLVYYRPLTSIPKDNINGHIVCHAFAADRNGLIMLGNHLGYGNNFGIAATLSYSFYVHLNGAEAVMDGNEWWLLEICWPRVSAGRCMMEVKVWSPCGKHVASGYQDGILRPKTPIKL